MKQPPSQCIQTLRFIPLFLSMTEDEPINNAMGKPQLTRKQRQNLSDTGKPWTLPPSLHLLRHPTQATHDVAHRLVHRGPSVIVHLPVIHVHIIIAPRPFLALIMSGARVVEKSTHQRVPLTDPTLC